MSWSISLRDNTHRPTDLTFSHPPNTWISTSSLQTSHQPSRVPLFSHISLSNKILGFYHVFCVLSPSCLNWPTYQNLMLPVRAGLEFIASPESPKPSWRSEYTMGHRKDSAKEKEALPAGHNCYHSSQQSEYKSTSWCSAQAVCPEQPVSDQKPAQ
jgi:hypothetical protein